MVPMKYKGLGFERYDGDTYNQPAVAKAKELLNESARGGYFYGGPGTGKSMLAAVLANEKSKLGTEVQFVSTGKFIAELSGISDDESRKKIFAEIEDAAFLVLDDFGALRVKAAGSEHILALLKHRSEKKLQTIISSSYAPDAIADRFEAPFGEEIAALLKNDCEVAQLK